MRRLSLRRYNVLFCGLALCGLSGCGSGGDVPEADIPLEKPFAERTFTLKMNSGPTMEFRAIPPGRFKFGGGGGGLKSRLKTVAKPFYMSRTEVTQKQWLDLMDRNPSVEEKGDDFPVHRLDWGDCQKFLRRLNEKYGAKTGMTFELPTEVQWEYACLANSDFYDETSILALGWVGGNAGNRIHPVGQKAPNFFGLLDMLGNVDEWCADRIDPATGKSVTDDRHIVRGGNWRGGSSECNARARVERRSTVPLRVSDGLRLICVPAKP